MIVINITRKQFQEIEQLRVDRSKSARRRGENVFSTNGREIWAGTNYTYTGAPAEEDKNLRGRYPQLDEIADALLSERPSGGRFFITQTGAFHKGQDIEDPKYWFVTFKMRA